jgi:CubicO group peptidase (beta-lactamase class C family)
MDGWLKAALDYLPRWLDYQVQVTEQPGCAVAVAHQGKVVLERAFGHADAVKRVRLTPRHRFRVASHSKSFTAAGILKLREQGRLRLDDPVGRWVQGLHPTVAEATPAQLLSHSAGLIRDGADAGQWQDRRPFADARALRAALAEPPVLEAGDRFKYSNHGYGLLGLAIEAIVGEPYVDWIRREVVAAAGLHETEPDVPLPKGAALARGHSRKAPLGRRVVVPGDNPTSALAPATGFVATAGDLARFFAQLDPAAPKSLLSPASRREMVRRLWRNPHSSLEQHYGLGVSWGKVGDWDWFGHGGGFQSCLSRTSVLPGRGIVVSVLTNALDGLAHQWSDGAIRILRRFAEAGAPQPKTRDWTGRWWSLWGTVDLVPTGEVVTVAAPGFLDPFMDASEIAVEARDRGTIRLANGYASHGEPVRRLRDRQGRVREVWLAGTRLLPQARLAAEMRRRYE